LSRGRISADRHISERTLADGRTTYAVQVKLFWPDGKVKAHYVGSYPSIEEARNHRDVALAEMQAAREQARAGVDSTDWQAEGVTAAEEPDEADVYERACREWAETAALERRRQSQTVTFPGPVATLVFAADQHVGGAGVDYPRLMHEATIIRDTPGMYAATVGDVVDNFVIAKLAHVRHGTRLTIPDEAVLARMYLRLLAPKLVAAVGGNHEGWTRSLAGDDFFSELISEVSPCCLYDPNDCRVTVTVGGCSWRVRMRHKWRGSSYLNATHGIERASREDQDFDIGVAAHTHVSGLARTFTTAGASRLALLCGSYKRIDSYAQQIGAAKANASTAVAVLLDSRTGTMTGIESLEEAAMLTRLANERAFSKC